MGMRNLLWRVISFVMNIATVVYKSCSNNSRNHSRPSTNEEVCEQATYLCEKYIHDRFSRTGGNRSNFYKCTVLTNPDICSEDTVKALCHYGKVLESAYPKLYNNVTGQLNFRINLEIVVCGMFTCVCDNILASGITWAKIVSLYAFAAALAVDCCQLQSDVRIARSISKWMGQYTNKRLCDWIRDHGGWDGLPIHFNEEKYCCALVTITKWFRKTALALSLGAFTGLAGLLTIWTGS